MAGAPIATSRTVFAPLVARFGRVNTFRAKLTSMFYRRQGIERGESTGVYAGNTPSLAPPDMPRRCYAFRGHRVPRALNCKKENMYHWSVQDLVTAIRCAPDGDIEYVSNDRAGGDRSKIWKFAGGMWVCDIESGSTCGHGTAAARARVSGQHRVGDVREVWAKTEIIILDDDGESPLLDVDRFTRIYGMLHLAVDSYENSEFRKEGPLPPRYGRFLCHCGDYASYETCTLVVPLQRYALNPAEDPWAPTQKIRKGKDEAPSLLQTIRRDIRLRMTTASEAYKLELDHTPEIQQEERDSASLAHRY